MKKTNLRLFNTVILLFIAVCDVLACTSVIVSGRVTPDGRPYIFKNRDTNDLDNLARYVKGKRYNYLAIVAANDKEAKNAWSGHNEVGFAIANTAAYNLNGDPSKQKTKEKSIPENDGEIMSLALGTCRTLKDFEHILDSLKAMGPIHANSNFAVLDAEGGVAYYETGQNGYTKFDANDPLIAPYGYLVRTNHAMSGDRALDKGVERYLAISDYMTRKAFQGNFDFKSIIRDVPRYLKHGLTGIDLNELQPQTAENQKLFPFRDFIPRYLTASSQLIQGVRKGENPLHTIAWTIIGSPLTTVTIPLVYNAKGILPKIVTANNGQTAPLVKAGFALKKRLFPLQRGSYQDYIDIAQLINKNGTGILQRIRPIEDQIFEHASGFIDSIYSDKSTEKTFSDFYQWIDNYVSRQYRQQFSINLQ